MTTHRHDQGEEGAYPSLDSEGPPTRGGASSPVPGFSDPTSPDDVADDHEQRPVTVPTDVDLVSGRPNVRVEAEDAYVADQWDVRLWT